MLNDDRPVAVLGAGAWGTALALLIARGGRTVTLWTRDPAHAAALARDGENRARLPGVALDPRIRPTGRLGDAAGAGLIVAAVPAQGWRGVAGALLPFLGADVPVVLTAKGVERGTGLLPHETTREVLGEVPLALLTGPSFAADVARGLPTAVTLAMADEATGLALCEALSGPTFRPYWSPDLTGAALGGAAKNVLAIACGIVMGRGFGESARAALTARGFAEIRRLAAALGGEETTLMGLSGLGDVVLSCTSAQSRNYRYGLALGEGQTPAGAADRAGGTVEGAWTAAAICERADRAGVDMPLAATVARIVEGREDVDSAARRLMSRPLKAE